jgi:uracil-DNA glycosylase family 4
VGTRDGGERGLKLLAELAQGCTRCSLYRPSRRHVVFGEGPSAARLVLLGEAPGEDEDAQGRPFVGTAGQALDRLLASVGLDRGRVYVANTVMCRPPDPVPPAVNRPPRTPEVAACASYLDLQLAVVRPAVIIAFGEVATRRLLGPIARLGDVRGQDHPVGDWRVVPTWHPRAWNRVKDRRAATQADVRLGMSLAGL